MIEFADPLALVAVPLAAALLWRVRRRPRPGLRWPGVADLAALRAGRARWVPAAVARLEAAAVLFAAVALAGPRWPDRHTRLPAEGVALVLAVDVSGSMAADDFPGPAGSPVKRLDAVKAAFRLLVAGGTAADGTAFPGRAGDQVGLVAFATWPDDVSPLTLSHSALLGLLDAEQPRAVPGTGETNVGDAIAESLHRLRAAGDRRRAVVLFSDGEHNVPPPALTPRQAARLAAAAGVPVHVVDAGGVAPPGDAEAAARREAGRANLRAVARITGGTYSEATDSAGLAAALAAIDRLERRPVTSWQFRRYVETAPALALVAFAALAGLTALTATVGREVPA